MQWRKASEKLPENNPDKLFVIRITFKLFEAEVAICYYAEDRFVYSDGNPVGEINDKIEWLDEESPTTQTGWQGEESGELKKKMQEIAQKYYKLYMSEETDVNNEYDVAYFAMQDLFYWLKSHTAPKVEKEKFKPITVSGRKYMKDHPAPEAEEPHRSAEVIFNEASWKQFGYISPAKSWVLPAMEAYHDQFKQSGSLTAKEILDSVTGDQGLSFCYRSEALKAMEKYASQFKQSPSIKRPTEASSLGDMEYRKDVFRYLCEQIIEEWDESGGLSYQMYNSITQTLKDFK